MMNNIKITRIKELLACLLIAFGFARLAVGQEATSNLLTTNSPFVRYLQNPPWIKEMRYVESQHWSAGSDPAHIDRTGWDNITNRVAIQPSGFFREVLTDSSGAPPRTPTERKIQGVSNHYYWNAYKDQPGTSVSSLFLSSKLPEEGASEKNLGFINSERTKASIERIRHFGLPPLLPNSFMLSGQNQFAAQTADGYALHGKILDVSDNRPLTLTYTLGGSANDVYIIRYEYKSDEPLPAYFERKELRSGRMFGNPITNWIEEVVYGTDAAISNGYKPSFFFTNLGIFTRLLMESNGQRYVVEQTGSKKLVDESPPGQKSNKERRIIIFIIPIIFLVLSGLFIRRIKKRG